MNALGAAAGALALAGLVACAPAPLLNVALPPEAPAPAVEQYRYRSLARYTDPQRNSEDVLVIVSLSGGGTRAAALAYGVLEALRNSTIRPFGRRARPIADEIDVLSGTSGGSFAALFYGLHRERMFERGPDGKSLFERRMLKRNIQGELEAKLLSNFLRLQTVDVNRSDLAAEVYDRAIFGPATYRELLRRGRPFVIINANDTTKGSRFEFTQEQFDLICSDLTPYPLARSVTASSAVHGIFAPIRLHNFPLADCPPEPAWVAAALREGGRGRATLIDDPRERLLRARLVRWYRGKEPYDHAPRPGTHYYVHLGDGGVVDNLGLRGPLQGALSIDSEWGVREAVERGAIRKIVVIAVNAQVPPGLPRLDRRRAGPGALRMLAEGVYAALGTVTQDTIRGADAALEALRRRHGRRRLAVYGPIVVEFARMPDRERECFESIETTLALPDAQVDALAAAGARLLLQHPEFNRLLAETGGTPAAARLEPPLGSWCKTASGQTARALSR